MKQADVTKGGIYLAKVSGRTVRVRVESVSQDWRVYLNRGKGGFKWTATATNLSTNRRIFLGSPQRLTAIVVEPTTTLPIGPTTYLLDRHTRGMGYVDLVMSTDEIRAVVTVYDHALDVTYPAAVSALIPVKRPTVLRLSGAMRCIPIERQMSVVLT